MQACISSKLGLSSYLFICICSLSTGLVSPLKCLGSEIYTYTSPSSYTVSIRLANRFGFERIVPRNAGVGLAFDLTICAYTGTSIDASYSTPISLTDNGSTAVYSVSPANVLTPVNGCVTFTLTPTTVGNINLDVGNIDFANIQTGNILVENLAVPSISYSKEIFDTDVDPTLHSDTLNDSWEGIQGDSCQGIAGGTFATVYGSLAYDSTNFNGSITGLSIMKGGTTGQAYGGMVTYQLVNMNGPNKGAHFINGNGGLSANPTNMQANSPKPSSISGDLHFTENTGSLVSRNALLFNFSTPVKEFGIWLGDLETNPFGTEAELHLFYQDALLTQIPILTSSSIAQQMNSGGTGCGSTIDYPGCGNHSTRWVYFSGAEVTDMLVIVGDDDVGGQGLTEHLSFGGPSMGGNCSISVLAQEIKDFVGRKEDVGIVLDWSMIQEEHFSFTVFRREAGGTFMPIRSDLKKSSYVDQRPLQGLNQYRIEAEDASGNHIISSPLLMHWESEFAFRIHPNPTHDQLFVQGGMGPLNVSIYYLLGKQVFTHRMDNSSGSIQLPYLVPGIYICTLSSRGQSQSFKLLIQP